MISQDHVKLAEMLAAGTKARRVEWKRSVDLDTFQLTFETNGIKLSRFEYDDRSSVYCIELLDGAGDQIDQFDSDDLDAFYRGSTGNRQSAAGSDMLREMFESARRQALGIDTALVTLIAQLEDAGVQTPTPRAIEIEDDEDPFKEE